MPDWRGACRLSGETICARLDALRDQITYLLECESDRNVITAYVHWHHADLVADVDSLARELCIYADAYDDPVLITEDSHYEPDLWAWLTDSNAHRGTAWLLPAAHHRLRVIAAEFGLEVATVPEEYSSQECHACGVLGQRHPHETFRCRNPACWVTTVSADYNAACVLAQRYYSGHCCTYDPLHTRIPHDRPAFVTDGGEP